MRLLGGWFGIRCYVERRLRFVLATPTPKPIDVILNALEAFHESSYPFNSRLDSASIPSASALSALSMR